MKNTKKITKSVIPENSKNLSGIYKILKEKLFNRIQGRFLFSKEGQNNSLKTKDYQLKTANNSKSLSFYKLSLGFTLVELIVVITILAILGTIAFVSFGSYSSNARNSTRISDISNISKGLQVFLSKGESYPEPENSINLYSGSLHIGYQGNTGERILDIIGLSSGGGKDPLDTTLYTYNINKNKTKAQITGLLEGEIGNRYPFEKGDSIGSIFYQTGSSNDLKYIPLQNYLVSPTNFDTQSGTQNINMIAVLDNSSTTNLPLVSNIDFGGYIGTGVTQILPINICIGPELTLEQATLSGFTFNTGSNTITSYSITAPKYVVIPCKIDGIKVENIGNSAFQNLSITGVLISNNIVSLGDYAFYNNPITNLKISNNIVSLGDYAFTNTSLINVINYDGITSNEYVYLSDDNNGIMIYNYFGTNKSPIIPSVINGKNVSKIGSMAFINKSLTGVTIPNSIIDIGSQAFDLNPLINVTNYDGISSNEYIYIPNNSGGITISQYFGTNKSPIIPSIINGKNVTDIGVLSFQNKSLTGITIPNSVINIGASAFQYNTSLTGITIPNSVINIGNYAFQFNSIKNITIPNSVINIGLGAFYKNTLTSVTILSNTVNIGSNAFYNQQFSTGNGYVYGSNTIKTLYDNNTGNLFDKVKLNHFKIQ